MEKKAKIFIASMGALISSAVIVGTATSIAWFDTRSKIEMDTNVVGSTEGSYFAYGKGNKDEPFGINKPRHLYNLAWLTYNGYFENKDNDGDDVKGDTFYFEIDPNIENDELNGLENNEPVVIPPIGTKEHPFYGTFNGNGKTIKNFVISNNFTDYKKTPYNVDADNFVAPEIVGFFGVIGGYPGNSYTYSTIANEFKNAHLESITIKTATPKSLVGIAAGYVNGPMNNITTDVTSIDVAATTTTALTDFTGNLSDYGVVGFATTNYKKGIKKVSSQVYQVSTNSEVFVADTSGATDAWGGSIAMQNIHNRLNNIRSNYATQQSVYSKYVSYYDVSGNLRESTRSNTASSRRTYTPTYKPNNYNEKIGSYVFAVEPSDTSEQTFLYMAGGHTSEIHYDSYRQHTGFKFTDGTNYLTVTSFTSDTAGTLGNLTTSGPTDATVWTFTGGTTGTIYTDFYYNTNGTDHYYNGSSIRYYLRNNNGNLVLSTTSTTWTRTVGPSGKVRYVNNNRFINFNGTNWVLSPLPDEPILPAAPTNDFNDPEPVISDYPNYAEPQLSDYPNYAEPVITDYPKDGGGNTIAEPVITDYPKDNSGNTIVEPKLEDYYDVNLHPEPIKANYLNGSAPGSLNPNNYLANSYQFYYEESNGTRHYFNNSGSTSSVGQTPSTNSDGGIAYGWIMGTSGSRRNLYTKIGNKTYYLNGEDGDEYSLTTSTMWADSFNWNTNSSGKSYIYYTSWWDDYYMTYTNNTFKSVQSNSYQYNVVIKSTSECVEEFNTNLWQKDHSKWETDIAAEIAEFNAAHEEWATNQSNQYNTDHTQWTSDQNSQYGTDHDQWATDQNNQYTAAHNQWETDKQEQYDAAHSAWVTARDTAQAEYEAALNYYNTVTVPQYETDHQEWEDTVYTLDNTASTSNLNGPDYYDDSTRTETGKWEYQAVYNGNQIYDTSYFPINVNQQSDVQKDNTKVLYEPTENNTGYFVGGGAGNLRFGRHNISSLSSNCYDSTNKKFLQLKTYDGSNVNITSAYAESHFEKYDKTVEKLEGIMKASTDNRVYGMHFYNNLENPTKVDGRYKTLAKYASINNEVKTNYELLTNSVDFNLKEQGIVNFIAGAYGKLDGSGRTTDVDSFFTISLVQRDQNEKIINVYEIDQILSDGKQNHSYVYLLTNGKYTTPFAYGQTNRKIKYKLDGNGRTTDVELPAGGEYILNDTVPTGYTTVKFDTDWLKMTGYNSGNTGTSKYYTPLYAYYFEIPVNDGEYALGNVESGNFGAYLMYLDIGASALSLTRTSLYEHFRETTYNLTIPLGIMVKDAASVAVFDYTNSLTIAIVPNYTGTITINRDDDDDDMTVSGSSDKATVQYVSDPIKSVHKPTSEGGGTIESSATPTVKDIYQLRYYDYNENTGAVIVTVLTDTYIDGVKQGSRNVEQKYADGTDVDEVEVYNSTTNGATVDETGQAADVASGVKLNDIQIESIDLQRASSDVVIEFRFTDKDGVTRSIDWSIDMDDLVTGPTFEDQVLGYSITITVTGGKIYVYVDSLDKDNVDADSNDYVITINGVIINSTTEGGQALIEIPVPSED